MPSSLLEVHRFDAEGKYKHKRKCEEQMHSYYCTQKILLDAQLVFHVFLHGCLSATAVGIDHLGLYVTQLGGEQSVERP